jgi:hypothetical protein
MSGKDNITTADLDTILDVNKKAIEIHSEVGRQNEAILEDLESKQGFIVKIDEKLYVILDVVKETNTAIKTGIEDKVTDIEKNVFHIKVILSTIGIGTIVAIIKAFLGH